MSFLTSKIVQAICWTLLHSLWQGLLLAVVTGGGMVLSKKAGSALRYKLLSCIFVAFLLVTGYTFYTQLQQAGNAGAATATITTNKPAPAAATHINNLAPATGANAWQGYVNNFVVYFDEHASLFVAIWFIIFMAQCVKILSGLVYIQRIRHYKTSLAPEFWLNRTEELAKRLHIKRRIQLLQSAIVKVPVVVGFLKPAILIPIGLLNNMPQEEVESILMHELAHIRRKDYFFNLLQCFVDVVFFFNPAVLWISSLIRNERENCCDDIAISETKSKKQFVQALVSFHQYNTAVSKYAMPFAARKTKLVNRVKRIVNNNNSTLNPVEKIVLIGCMVAFSIAFITVSNGQTATPKKPSDKTNTLQATPNKNNAVTPNKQANKTAVKKDNSAVQKPVNGVAVPDEVDDADNNNVDNNNVDNNRNTGNLLDVLHALGYTNITADELIELSSHGVTGGYVQGLDDAGYKNLKFEKIIEARDHGVSIGFINSLGELGYKNIKLDDVIELIDHGVSAAFIKGLNSMGYKNIKLDDATELVNHGVNADYIKSLNNAGFTNLTLEKLTELKDHGVNAEYINSMRSIGVTNLTPDAIQDLRDQGITADFITGWRKAGYTNITIENAMELREHGVTVEFINSIKKLGFTNITTGQAIELRDHGVDASYIESIKKKTGGNFTLDKYIGLRDHGFGTK